MYWLIRIQVEKHCQNTKVTTTTPTTYIPEFKLPQYEVNENVAGVLDAVDAINKELRIYTGFINDTGKELPTIIAFEDILEIEVNMT